MPRLHPTCEYCGELLTPRTPDALPHECCKGRAGVYKPGLAIPVESLDDKITFKSGASSSSGAQRFDLLPLNALRVLSTRFEEGVVKHGLNNWRKGITDPAWVLDRFNHIFAHLYAYAEQVQGVRPEPDEKNDTRVGNLAAAMWGCAILIEAEMHARTSESGTRGAA